MGEPEVPAGAVRRAGTLRFARRFLGPWRWEMIMAAMRARA